MSYLRGVKGVKPTSIISHWSAIQEDMRPWCSIGLQLQKEVPILLKRFPDQDINILECAVGKGEHAQMLRHYGFYVTTVDLDPENNPDIVHDLNYPLSPHLEGEVFNAITSHHTLEHLEFFIFDQHLKDFYEMLHPRGVLFVSLPSRCRPLGGFFRFARWRGSFVTRQLKTFTPDGWHKWEIDQNHRPQTIKKIMEEVGFIDVEIHTSYLNPFEYQFVAYKGGSVNEKV